MKKVSILQENKEYRQIYLTQEEDKDIRTQISIESTYKNTAIFVNGKENIENKLKEIILHQKNLEK